MGCENCIMSKIKNNNSSSIQISERDLNSCNKLNTYDWLKNLPDASDTENLVEIQFKNTRKEFYVNEHKINLNKGDIVAVEANPGHDIGIVSLTGPLASLQFKNKVNNRNNVEIKKIYRKAKPGDVQKWKEGKELENLTMIKARKISDELKLNMKIGDVEYQGDKSKAIFYYIADGRIDFRELIKKLASEFKVSIEMRQIGARQEAGRIGGIGSCGKELCCSTWKTDLGSVTIDAAKYQNLSLNAQRFAGQCGKLKCCLMYELDTYMEAWQEFPDELLELETKKGTAYKHKVDVLKKVIWYTFNPGSPDDLIPLDVSSVKNIIMLNKKGIKPDNI